MTEFDRKRFALDLINSMNENQVSDVVDMNLPGTEGWRVVALNIKAVVREAYSHRNRINPRELGYELSDGLTPVDEAEAAHQFTIVGSAWELVVGDPDGGVGFPTEPVRFMDLMRDALRRAYEEGVFNLVTHLEELIDEAEGDHDIAVYEAEEAQGATGKPFDMEAIDAAIAALSPEQRADALREADEVAREVAEEDAGR